MIKISINPEDYRNYFNENYNKIFQDNNSDNIYNQIIETDVSQNKQYIKWLVKLFLKQKLKVEDFYKAKEYLTIFNKLINKKILPIEQRDINRYNDLSQLFQTIESYKQDKSLDNKSDIYKNNLVFEGNLYNVYIPKSYKDSCIIGSGTEWCTATGNTDGPYNNYTKQGDLIIIINKSDKKEKYQFHQQSNQFMNRSDSNITIDEINLLKQDKKLIEYLKKYFNLIWKIKFQIELGEEDLVVKGNLYCYNNNLTIT